MKHLLWEETKSLRERGWGQYLTERLSHEGSSIKRGKHFLRKRNEKIGRGLILLDPVDKGPKGGCRSWISREERGGISLETGPFRHISR